MELNDLAGRTVIITGAASGIGLSTACVLASQGAKVAMIDIDAKGLYAAALLVEDSGGKCISLPGDITDREAVDDIIGEVLNRWGSISALVNGAGIHELVDLQDITAGHVDRMLRVNLLGVINLTQAVLPSMAEAGSGSIVSVSSLSGIRGHPVDAKGGNGAAHYAASKGAVIAFIRSVAREVAHIGVRANCVAPGMIRTPMNESSYSAEEVSEYADTVPLGRIGEPEEVANVIAFFCSDASSYITGQVLNVCGGVLMA
jgi:NAD(P)-dependent dehydrogenase (short-subunit alcohol dehydrogenase family)